MRRIHLAGLVATTLLEHAWEWLGGFFLSKVESDRRASERLADLEKEEMESERLDRLRNPRDYQGK